MSLEATHNNNELKHYTEYNVIQFQETVSEERKAL
jgi:hypothetical protein